LSLWFGLLIITGIGAGFMLLFELSKRNEGMRIISPCIILAFLAVVITNPAEDYIIKFVAYTIGFIFVYVVINAYKNTAASHSAKDKNPEV
jgi:bacteriorhodopsin